MSIMPSPILRHTTLKVLEIPCSKNEQGLESPKLRKTDVTIFVNGQTYTEKSFENEENLESLVASNSKLLFGSETIYIDAKKKLEAKALGGTILKYAAR